MLGPSSISSTHVHVFRAEHTGLGSSLEQAKAESARIIERAGREAELEKKKALDEMKQEMITIASLMAGKAVAGSMDVKVQEELIDRTLKEIGDETWQS